jgi:glycosyltransferase involved in cell wall biosynthesis
VINSQPETPIDHPSLPAPTATGDRILFILPDLSAGGAERMTLRLASDLSALGFQPTVFLMHKRGRLIAETPGNVNLAWALGGNRQEHRTWVSIVRNVFRCARNCDVVVGALELEPIYLAYLFGRVFRKPAIGWVRTSLNEHLMHLSIWHKLLAKRLYPRLDRIVLLSRGSLDSLGRLVRVPQQSVAIISSYLDWNSLQTKAIEAVPLWASPIFIRPTVISVGRLVEAKGLDVLLRAHSRLRAAGLDCNLLILGEGPLRAELESLAGSLSIEKSVFMPGFVENPFSLMRAAQVFALPSRYEGLPLALLEALGVGAASVATDCPGGSRELLDNGRCGLLVPPDDDTALASAICKLLSDSRLANDLKSAGPERASAFRQERSVRDWATLLLEVQSRTVH